MKYVVWGTRASGQFVAHMAKTVGEDVAAYCSSNRSSQQKTIDGLRVISPEELAQMYSAKKIDGVLLGVQNPVYLREIEKTVHELFPSDFSFAMPHEVLEPAYLSKIHEKMQFRWKVAFEEQAEIWLQSFMGEVQDWVRDNANLKGRFHQVYMDRLNNADFLGIDNTCCDLAETLHAGSIVLDIGCGMATMYGNRLPNSECVHLVAMDPLAPFYNRINQRIKKTPPVKFGLFEFAANFCDRNYCDLILINNALDHCIDPYKSLIECLYILKCGGILRLRHRRAEAVFEAYQGLHKWNIDYSKSKELIFWNQENAINVSNQLKDIADIRFVETNEVSSRQMQKVIVEITKKRDFSLEEWIDAKQEQQQLAFIVEGLMNWIAEHSEAEYINLPE